MSSTRSSIRASAQTQRDEHAPKALRRMGDAVAQGPLVAIGLVLLATLVLLGLFGPYLPLGDATKIAAGPRLTPPSWRFPFGTEELGRSFLPRVILGIRATFFLSASAVLITSCLGTVL